MALFSGLFRRTARPLDLDKIIDLDKVTDLDRVAHILNSLTEQDATKEVATVVLSQFTELVKAINLPDANTISRLKALFTLIQMMTKERNKVTRPFVNLLEKIATLAIGEIGKHVSPKDIDDELQSINSKVPESGIVDPILVERQHFLINIKMKLYPKPPLPKNLAEAKNFWNSYQKENQQLGKEILAILRQLTEQFQVDEQKAVYDFLIKITNIQKELRNQAKQNPRALNNSGYEIISLIKATQTLVLAMLQEEWTKEDVQQLVETIKKKNEIDESAKEEILNSLIILEKTLSQELPETKECVVPPESAVVQKKLEPIFAVSSHPSSSPNTANEEVAKMQKLLKQLTTTKILKEPTFICELLDQISCAEKSLQSTTPPTLFNNTPCRMVEKTKEHILNTITSFWSEKALDNQIRNQKQLLELRTTEDDDDDEKYDINEFIDGLSKLKEKLYPIQRPDAAPPCAAASSL